MKIKQLFLSSSLFITLLFSPIAALADHNDFHIIQQLQSQLASLQQAFFALLAAAATTPAQSSQGIGIATQPAVPAKKAATSTAPTTSSATPAQPYSETGTSAQPAISAIPARPTPQAEVCYTCSQPTLIQQETIGQQGPSQETKEVIRSLQMQVSEAREKVIQQLKTNVQSLQTQILELQSKQPELSENQGTALLVPGITFTRTLRRGSFGDDVKQLQEFLANPPAGGKEIYPQGLATGFYGPATEAAVKRFQEKNGIEAIGIVGPKTRIKLQDLMSCSSSMERPCYERETGGKIIRLDQTAGENSFSMCMNSASRSERRESTQATTVCGDEIYQYCTEGQSSVLLKKFDGKCKAAPPVTVVSPNGGEEIAQGYNRYTNQFIVDPAVSPYAKARYYDIKFSGGKGVYRIMLVKENVTHTSDPRGLIVGTIGYGTLYPGLFLESGMTVKEWEPTFSICIGQGDPWLSCNSMYIAPGRYKILVLSENENGELLLWDESANKPGNWDVSDEAFTVVPHSKIKIISPNGGETLLTGSNAVINWEVEGIGSRKVSVALLKQDKGMVYFIATNVPLSSESGSFTYTWKVRDADSLNQQYNNNQYYIAVQEVLEGQSGGSYYMPTASDIQATDLSDGSFTLAGSAIAPIIVPTSVGPKDINAGWGITFHHTNKTSLYFHAINFTHADPLPSAFRVYMKRPGESVFSRATEFSKMPTACGSLVSSSNSWLLYQRCGNESSWKIDSASLTTSQYPIGVYRMYLAAVDASGKETLSPEFEMAALPPLTVLAPTLAQSPVASPVIFQWTTPSGWPQSSAYYTVQLYDSALLPNPWIYTKSVVVPSISTTGAFTYDGPALDPTKTYLTRIYGLRRWGVSPICPSCDYISMDNATQVFSVKP